MFRGRHENRHFVYFSNSLHIGHIILSEAYYEDVVKGKYEGLEAEDEPQYTEFDAEGNLTNCDLTRLRHCNQRGSGMDPIIIPTVKYTIYLLPGTTCDLQVVPVHLPQYSKPDLLLTHENERCSLILCQFPS